MSRLIYLIQVWGGCSGYLIGCLQLLQNRAARAVTRLEFSTPVKTLLLQCGWLSVNQLVYFHTLILTFNIRKHKQPLFLSKKLSHDFSRLTRLALSDGIRRMDRNKLSVTQASFRVRATKYWNSLPTDIRQCSKIGNFKVKVKAWIKANVSVY